MQSKFLSVFLIAAIATAVSLLSSSSAQAAISKETQNSVRNISPILRGTGAIHGGLAGRGFSLLDVKSEIAKSQQLERLTVSIGDAALQPYAGAPGYFHIENRPESRQIIIHFLQALNAKFDEKRLQQAFAKSPFVKSSQITFEPEAQTMSLVLQMKRPASLRVIPVNGTKNKTAQLRIEMFEDSLLNQAAVTRRPAALPISSVRAKAPTSLPAKSVAAPIAVKPPVPTSVRALGNQSASQRANQSANQSAKVSNDRKTTK